MFSKHPNGLIAAALANMGERFGFYIMMAILTLFISAKFGLSETTTGYIYSAFYASIYILALAGGIIADKTKNFKGTILAGLVMMAVGYLIIAIPTPTPVPSMGLYLGLTCLGLLVIAFGNGLFKGNLQALVGQMYDDPSFVTNSLKKVIKWLLRQWRILHRWPIRLRSTAATWLIWVHLSITTWMCLTVVSNMLSWLPLLPC